MKARVSFALLLIVVAGAAFGATTVRGKVVAENGSPYPDVEVTVQETKEVLYTDSEGDFFVQNLEAGREYTVTVKTSRSTSTHRITTLAQPVTPVRIAVK